MGFTIGFALGYSLVITRFGIGFIYSLYNLFII